jgi:hypothetical protein
LLIRANVNAAGNGTTLSGVTSQTSSPPAAQTSPTSDPARSAFAATLALNSLSSQQTTAGIPSPALQEALSKGGVNPAAWLSPSDISLFEQTTGGTIKDGTIYDKNGAVNSDMTNTDLVCSLFEMRNFGTFSNDQPQLIQGAITANDLEGFIDHYKNDPAINTTILNKALTVLKKQ